MSLTVNYLFDLSERRLSLKQAKQFYVAYLQLMDGRLKLSYIYSEYVSKL